MSLSCTVSEI